ncbi:nuclear transport factor 2 family protein [Aeromicrobium sp. YIM 150415]|uniref:nuclear transport factor 2 family protein n=1 Tax=Aeromicrobium sp. YIM 150415 TaxID=2803912 RepID=UPI001965122D|nr:nuclear transport factor 2 family protein [Aeromicrobium sp. YIM 150415]MBM9464059.1 nuclear transport factor 2 family protein [Aeromicrobium sp. YIM 150415]
MDDRLVALEERLSLLEDEKSIHELLSRYGHYADAPLDDEYFALFTEDCVMDVSSGRGEDPYAIVRWEGRDAMRDFLRERTAEQDDGFYGRSMHMQGNNVTIDITGDAAIARGYSFVLHQDGPSLKLLSASLNEWAFRRENGRWLIQMRRRRMPGAPDAADLLRGAQ